MPFILFVVCNSTLNGQTNSARVPFINNFTEKDFNSLSDQNWDIVQDNRGVLYFANDYGIMEFDGSNWSIIQIPVNRSITRSLAFGSDGKLYFGAQDFFGVIKSTRSAGTGINVESIIDSLPAGERTTGDIWKTISWKDKIVFFGWNGLYIYSGQKIKSIHELRAFKMAFQVGDKIIIHSETGLKELIQDSLVMLPYTEKLGSLTVSMICSFPGDKLLIGTQNNGFYLYDRKILSPFKIKANDQLIENNVQCGILLRNGNYLAGTAENGVIQFDKEGNLINHYNKKNGLGHNRIRHLFEDRDGNWWIINEKGIDLIEASSSLSRINIDMENSYSIYTSLVFNNRLYIGSHAGLYSANWPELSMHSAKSRQFDRINQIGWLCWKLDTIANHLVLCSGNGLYEITGEKAESLYSESGVWTIVHPSHDQDKFVAGTYNGLAMFALSGNKLSFKKKLSGFSETSRVMEEDASGNIWISHGYKGVYKVKIDYSKDSIVSVRFYDAKKGFPTNLFINVFKINNEIVFGTQNGIYKYDEVKDSMVIHSRFAPVFGTKSHVRYLHEDKLKRIWYVVGQLTGVLSINPDGRIENQRVPFQKLTKDYIPGFENIYFLKDGSALIGTRNSLIYYDQSARVFPKSTFASIISLITDPSDKSIVYYDGRQNYFDSIKIQSQLKIPFKRNQIRFDYTSCFYENMENTVFSYYLEGFDDAWSEWTNTRFKEFSNLGEGKYTFHIKAKNVYEVESTEVTYHFIVLPPWYRSTLMYLFYIFLVSLIFWLSLRWRTKRLEIKMSRIIDDQEKKHALDSAKFHEERLLISLENKNKEVAANTIKILHRNEKLLEIKGIIESMEIGSQSDISRKRALIIQFIDKELTEDNWDDFEKLFDQVNNNFIHRLKEAYHDLSPRDLKICVYLRMNLSTKEIAQILNMTIRGVETARFRIRKRMGLEPADNLNGFLIDF